MRQYTYVRSMSTATQDAQDQFCSRPKVFSSKPRRSLNYFSIFRIMGRPATYGMGWSGISIDLLGKLDHFLLVFDILSPSGLETYNEAERNDLFWTRLLERKTLISAKMIFLNSCIQLPPLHDPQSVNPSRNRSTHRVQQAGICHSAYCHGGV